jgi:NADPH-dependent 2,4-dienoyl-CoA reductase/sulfur reductase-like enzyme
VVAVSRRLVVIGGDAAGMTAASQAKRRAGDDIEVVALERSHHASYSACGIPYWIGGDVGSEDDLVARTPEEHRRRGIDLRMRHEASALDVDRRQVTVTDLEHASSYALGFDELVIATGAVPVRPDLPGVDAEGIYGVQTLDDGDAIIDALERYRPNTAVVVGGGYIGIEMAEALVRHGLSVTVVDRAEEPMTTLDPDMGRLVHEAMEAMGIDVRTECDVESFVVEAGHVQGVVVDGKAIHADLVVLGIGVRPNTALAADAGLPLGESGGLRVDRRLRVVGQEGIWSGGDCVETFNRVSQRWGHIPLGTHANKHGRVIGENVAGGYATFPGVVGTAISKVCDLEIGRTGLLEAEATAAGLAFEPVTIEATTTAGYLPTARPMTVKLLAERRSGRLLGAQIVGREGSGKRIDVCAVALWNEMTVEQMTGLDLGYAPPFSPVWDPVLVAARAAASTLFSGPGGALQG